MIRVGEAHRRDETSRLKRGKERFAIVMDLTRRDDFFAPARHIAAMISWMNPSADGGFVRWAVTTRLMATRVAIPNLRLACAPSSVSAQRATGLERGRRIGLDLTTVNRRTIDSFPIATQLRSSPTHMGSRASRAAPRYRAFGEVANQYQGFDRAKSRI